MTKSIGDSVGDAMTPTDSEAVGGATLDAESATIRKVVGSKGLHTAIVVGVRAMGSAAAGTPNDVTTTPCRRVVRNHHNHSTRNEGVQAEQRLCTKRVGTNHQLGMIHPPKELDGRVDRARHIGRSARKNQR